VHHPPPFHFPAIVLSIISFSVQRLDVCENWMPLDDDEKETTSLQLTGMLDKAKVLRVLACFWTRDNQMQSCISSGGTPALQLPPVFCVCRRDDAECVRIDGSSDPASPPFGTPAR